MIHYKAGEITLYNLEIMIRRNWKFIFRLFVGCVLLPSAVVAAIYSLNQAGFFNIDHIDIVVENSVDQPQYLQPLVAELDKALEPYRGMSLWNIQLSEVIKKVGNFKWLEDVSLSRSWPTRLKASVKVKEVKLLMVTRGGQFIPVVSDGTLLSPVELRRAPDVALLQGEIFEKKPDIRKKAIEVLEEIPKHGTFSQKTISEVHYDDKEGFWMTLIYDGVRVKMGHEQVALKSVRVGQVIEYMDAHNYSAKVIDANLSKKVLVRLKESSISQ